MNLEQCIWSEACLKQLELVPEKNPLETKYYALGCYNCDGDKKDCEYYSPVKYEDGERK